MTVTLAMGPRREATPPRRCFQFLHLPQVPRAVGSHPPHEVSYGQLTLHFGVERRLGKVSSLQTSQQAQVVMASQPVECRQFRGRRIHVVQVTSPGVLIEWGNRRFPTFRASDTRR